MNASASAMDFVQRCGGAFLQQPDQDIRLSGLAIDSRQVRPGDLFAAIRGTRVDGHCFCRGDRSFCIRGYVLVRRDVWCVNQK